MTAAPNNPGYEQPKSGGHEGYPERQRDRRGDAMPGAGPGQGAPRDDEGSSGWHEPNPERYWSVELVRLAQTELAVECAEPIQIPHVGSVHPVPGSADRSNEKVPHQSTAGGRRAN